MGTVESLGIVQPLIDFVAPATSSTSTAETLLPGSCGESFHDKYGIGKLLGKGSQGRVHVCNNKDTKEQFAVKICDYSKGDSVKTAYLREVELCKACSSSPNVVQVMEEFCESGTCYVVMEKFEGHLRKGLKWIAKYSGDEVQVLGGVGNAALRRILQQALSGVVYMHRSGIVHRDVKAHNLLIDRLDVRDVRLQVVVSDLGLARRLESGRFLSTQVGTRKYWAPELYDKKYWHTVDMFSIGVVLFLAATSTYPYFDEAQTRERDVFADNLVPEALLPNAKDFLVKCLEKNPWKRPCGEQQMLHPWFENCVADVTCDEFVAFEPDDAVLGTPRSDSVTRGPRVSSRIVSRGPDLDGFNPKVASMCLAPRPRDVPVHYTDRPPYDGDHESAPVADEMPLREEDWDWCYPRYRIVSRSPMFSPRASEQLKPLMLPPSPLCLDGSTEPSVDEALRSTSARPVPVVAAVATTSVGAQVGDNVLPIQMPLTLSPVFDHAIFESLPIQPRPPTVRLCL